MCQDSELLQTTNSSSYVVCTSPHNCRVHLSPKHPHQGVSNKHEKGPAQWASLDDARKYGLKHYLECQILWTLAATSASLPQVFCDLSARERLCFFNTSTTGLNLLATVYRGYHAIKFGHRSSIDEAIVSEDFTQVHLPFIELSRDAYRHP